MTTPDAEANLRRMRTMIEGASTLARGDDVEIFHRASVRRRVALVSRDARPEIQEVMEEGIAVRARSGDRDGFAAAAGAEAALPWALERARAGRTSAGPSHAQWARGEPVAMIDRVEPRMPEVDELLAWLERMGGAQPGARPWVEEAFTVETLGSSLGLRASRTRTRAWAMAVLPSTPGGREQPRTIQGRGLGDLDASDWLEQPDPGPPITPRGSPLLFRGEASRALVLGLVAALHSEGGGLGVSVGRGWSLRDDPVGTFDDGGFPTQSVLLADGHETLAALEGPGHLRRASYRDWPEPHPACLTVFARNESFPEDATHIVDVRIHGSASGWIVECDGFESRGGECFGWFRGGLLRTSPAAIVRRITATAGPARAIGPVLTPALVVEGLAFEG